MDEALAFFEEVELEGNAALIGREILKELRQRLTFLREVGLGYLTLDRSAATLAGGEAQRIRLATQIGAGLKGVLYVLDEPSIGLHARDNERLLRALKRLRDAGNTVIVVEHDDATIRTSDFLVDIGPGAGREGGRVVCAGTPAEVWGCKQSITAAYLRGDVSIPVPGTRRTSDRALVVRGAQHHNLKKIDVRFPLGVLIGVTGVSGSGKSTLVNDVLRRALAQKLHHSQLKPGKHERIDGLEQIDKVIEIDQAPIGRTPRSNAATYTKLWADVRELYAKLPEARARGYMKGRFSFNVKGGRCETCLGAGVKTVEMQFLPDVEIRCTECNTRRFNEETLEIEFKGRNIADVLDMTVVEACEFFADHPRLARILGMLRTVGLGYLPLGQPATTLSGGEAQRVKIASELGRPGTGSTLYILDEPTTGLHHEDIKKLMRGLEGFVEKGNTVIVVEHNLDVIKRCDYLIDLGPEGGDGGGNVVVAGTPEEVAASAQSHTGKVLRPVLRPRRPRPPASRKRVRNGKRTRDLIVEGASLHNLQGVSVRVPADAITVVTGPSGSGKTSLAFDTIFAEGQRRYVESLSTYARRFLGRMDKPPVERIAGLGPAIAIDQRNRGRSPRSTVATATEIHDYLRLLYARAGTPRCPVCDKVMRARDPSREAARLVGEHEGRRVLVLAPLRRKGLQETVGREVGPPLLERFQREGFLRLLVDGRVRMLSEPGALEGEVDLVIDRIQVKSGSKRRLAEALTLAYRVGRGLAGVIDADDPAAPDFFTERPGCAEHGIQLPSEMLEPRMFSFNSHHGACPVCHGLGTLQSVDPAQVLRYPGRTLKGGAFGHGAARYLVQSGWYWAQIEEVARVHGLPLKDALKKWPQRELDVLFRGTGDQTYSIDTQIRRGRRRTYRLRTETTWPGVCTILEGWYRKSGGGRWTDRITEVMRTRTCEGCGGARLGPLSRGVTLGRNLTLPQLVRQTVADALATVQRLRITEREVMAEVQGEILSRLRFLKAVGLGYLTLDRATATLAGGEAQRIRLATQIGSSLVGVIYVLDEPTIGLHPRDTGRLLGTLRDLRDLGNTVLLVEHDAETIRAADHVIDMGPGAGRHGGKVVFQGSVQSLLRRRGSSTAGYLSGRLRIGRPPERGEAQDWLRVQGARVHNLKDLDVAFPAARLTCITGVSGSGKSTLLLDVVWNAAERAMAEEDHGGGKGFDQFDTVYVVDQLPLGSTPASNPATYTKLFDPIRKLFAKRPEARRRGYDPGRFSFNRPGGRCEGCEGRGALRVEMHFLADVWVPCEDCRGRRYNPETLQVKFKGKSIADVL
ncbi:MAG: excinuclease ABC subunit UvrA, partial [Planctomycetota bacterium]